MSEGLEEALILVNKDVPSVTLAMLLLRRRLFTDIVPLQLDGSDQQIQV